MPSVYRITMSSGRKLVRFLAELHACEDPERRRACCSQLCHTCRPRIPDEGRQMSRIGKVDQAVRGSRAPGIAASRTCRACFCDKQVVQLASAAAGLLLGKRQRPEVAPELGHEQGGGDSLARHIADHDACPVAVQPDKIVKIAAHFLGRRIMRAEPVAR